MKCLVNGHITILMVDLTNHENYDEYIAHQCFICQLLPFHLYILFETVSNENALNGMSECFLSYLIYDFLREALTQ